MTTWSRPTSRASWAGSIASTRNGKNQGTTCVPVGSWPVLVPVAYGFAADGAFHASCRLVLPQAGTISLVALLAARYPWQIGRVSPFPAGTCGSGWSSGAVSGLVVVYTYSSSVGILVSPFSESNCADTRYSTWDWPGAGLGTCTATSNSR